MEERVLIEVKPGAELEDEAAAVHEAQNSLACFKWLYLRWLSPVYRYFYFRTGNVKDAEYLTSQIFHKVYEELPRYHTQAAVLAWQEGIVRRDH
jgi:DNA-directed RNA polymerase specialized sigma24 family protein